MPLYGPRRRLRGLHCIYKCDGSQSGYSVSWDCLREMSVVVVMLLWKGWVVCDFSHPLSTPTADLYIGNAYPNRCNHGPFLPPFGGLIAPACNPQIPPFCWPIPG